MKSGSVVGTPSPQVVLQLPRQHPGEPRAEAWGQEDAGTLDLVPGALSRSPDLVGQQRGCRGWDPGPLTPTDYPLVF